MRSREGRVKVYFAAAYTARDVLRDDGYIYALELHGHTCTSTWLQATHEITPDKLGPGHGHSLHYLEEHVGQDIADVQRSDALILFTEPFMRDVMGVQPPYGTGGRHVETGIALAAGKFIIVLGEPENVFHRTSRTRVSSNWAHAMLLLETEQRKRDENDHVTHQH